MSIAANRNAEESVDIQSGHTSKDNDYNTII